MVELVRTLHSTGNPLAYVLALGIVGTILLWVVTFWAMLVWAVLVMLEVQ